MIDTLHIELSTLCNASCPCCARYIMNSTVVGEYLDVGYISIDKFKKWFPVEVLNDVRYLRFCGNHGDPCTNPDLIEIINYLSNFNFKRFQINTNGGMKTPQFWKELSLACNSLNFETLIVFSIDGLEDTNEIYRRNVSWKKLLENVKSFNSNSTNRNIWKAWDYLVFKHNEHQIEEAKNLSIELGFDKIHFKSPINLDDGINITPVPVLDGSGKIINWLYPSTLDEFKPKYLSTDAEIVYIERELHEQVGWFDDELSQSDLNFIEKFDKIKVEPRCVENDFYVESHGDVYQCCFVANDIYTKKKHYLEGKYVEIKFKQQFDSMNKIGFEKFNLNTNTIENIIKDKLLYNIYNNSWDKTFKEGKILECANICGNMNCQDVLFESQRSESENMRKQH